MGSKFVRETGTKFSRDENYFYDDFNAFTDTQVWTVAVAGTGTVAKEANLGSNVGRMKFFNTAANDAAVLATTSEDFKLTAGKSMYAECRLIFTDVDTDDGMVGFGFADALAATTMADTTGAITATDALMIYKLPDSTYWSLHTEINTLANKGGDGSSTAPAASTLSDTTAGGTSYQTLGLDIKAISSTLFHVRAMVNDVPLETSNGVAIVHTVALGTATDLDFGVIVKSIDAADFNVYVDYVYVSAVR